MLLLEYEGHAVSQDNYRSSTGAECLLTNKMQFAQLSPLQQEQEEAIGQNGRKERGSGWFLLRKSNALILLFPTRKAQSKPVAVEAAAPEEQSRMVQFLWSSFLLACEELLLLRQFPLLRFLRKLNCLLGVSSRIMKHGFHFRRATDLKENDEISGNNRHTPRKRRRRCESCFLMCPYSVSKSV